MLVVTFLLTVLFDLVVAIVVGLSLACLLFMKRMADGSLRGYEYLDGREVFSDDFKVNMRDVLDRFYILYSEAKGSTEKIRASPSRSPTSRPRKC